MFSISQLLICFLLVAMGATYEFIKTASANLREREDHYNVALGGFFSGAILGLRRKSEIKTPLTLQWLLEANDSYFQRSNIPRSARIRPGNVHRHDCL